MLTLAWPWLACSLVLPLAARLLPRAPRSEAALRVPFFALVRRVESAASPVPRRFRTVLALLAWLALVLAACRPQWLDDPLPVPVTGRSMLLAMDVSASMRESDLQPTPDPAQGPSRLNAAQRNARTFIEGRLGDRIGLVLFGSRAALLCPLTFDRHTVAGMVDEAQVGMAGELTALGDAIGLSVKQLRGLPASQRVVVLLTDGANTAGVMAPLDAARLARHHAVRVHTIGVGSPGASLTGGPDHDTLRDIARITGGRHFRATNAGALARVYGELDALEPAASGTQRLRPARDLYSWPLGLALLLALAMLLGPWLGRLAARGVRARASSGGDTGPVAEQGRG